MLHSPEEYISKGVITHQVVDIVVLAAANILWVNLCIYNNVNVKSIPYCQAFMSTINVRCLSQI